MKTININIYTKNLPKFIMLQDKEHEQNHIEFITVLKWTCSFLRTSTTILRKLPNEPHPRAEIKSRESSDIKLVRNSPNVYLLLQFAWQHWQMCQHLEQACSFAQHLESFAKHSPLDGTLVCDHHLSYMPSCLQIHPVPIHHVETKHGLYWEWALHSHTLKLQTNTYQIFCAKILYGVSEETDSQYRRQGFHIHGSKTRRCWTSYKR